MTNQDVRFQPLKTVLFEPIILWQFGFLICIQIDQSGTGVKIFAINVGFPFVSDSFFLRLYLHSLQTVYLKFLLLLHPRLLLAVDWWQQTFATT